MADTMPRMMPVQQRFAAPPPVDIAASVEETFHARLEQRITPGSSIGIGVGSRGITNLAAIVGSLVRLLKTAGCRPFLLPAMGSHGGATAEGQAEVLATYGITEQTMGVPVRASMEVERIGSTPGGLDVYCSLEALRAEGVIVVNRVKPHTDFSGEIGSGIQKMIAIGLGKQRGAQVCHFMASRLGHEAVIRSAAEVVLHRVPILGGLAILENQRHETAHIEFVPRDSIVGREGELLSRAKQLMPSLPFFEIDLLIIDRIGKNISGAGMDPNIVGRSVQGYSSALTGNHSQQPVIRRIFVRDLTPETHGNAIGIGMADITTSRLVESIDARVTAVNALTALTLQTAKVPIHFHTDREALAVALTSLALPAGCEPKVVRIADTLALEKVDVSSAYCQDLSTRSDLQPTGSWEEMQFDTSDNLLPLHS